MVETNPYSDRLIMQQVPADTLRKILIVDDNRIIRHLLKLTFEDNARFEVLEADCGDSALTITKREHPDLLILDVMMPGELNGFQVCEIIKSWSDTKDCKVVLLSARCQQSDIEQGREAKADHYVTKPFSPTELLALVESLLSSKGKPTSD